MRWCLITLAYNLIEVGSVVSITKCVCVCVCVWARGTERRATYSTESVKAVWCHTPHFVYIWPFASQTAKLPQAKALLTCIWEMSGPILSHKISSPHIFSWFPSTFSANSTKITSNKSWSRRSTSCKNDYQPIIMSCAWCLKLKSKAGQLNN